MSSSPNRPACEFGAFCTASFLLSIAYGSTFLLALLVKSFGGNERDAGQVIATAMLSTLTAVISSGHMINRWGSAGCVTFGAACLACASLGFVLVQGLGIPLMLCALLLGLGWGVFYTVGPIMITTMVESARLTLLCHAFRQHADRYWKRPHYRQGCKLLRPANTDGVLVCGCYRDARRALFLAHG